MVGSSKHQERVNFYGEVGERKLAKPFDKIIDLGRIECLRQRIEPAGQGYGLLGQREEMQVVVAKHRNHRLAE